MNWNLKSALAAIIVLGSASLALADDYTDQAADAMRSYGPIVNQPAPFTTKSVALPGHVQTNSSWMDRASQTFGGGY